MRALELCITGHVICNQAYIIFIFSPIKIGGISDCLLLRRRFWILTILNKVQHCKTIITLHQQLMATLLNQDLLRLFDQEIKGMWTGFLKILLQSATRIKYRPKKTKVKKKFGSIFYGGETSFFRAKNLSVSNKSLWSVLCLLLLWIQPPDFCATFSEKGKFSFMAKNKNSLATRPVSWFTWNHALLLYHMLLYYT